MVHRPLSDAAEINADLCKSAVIADFFQIRMSNYNAGVLGKVVISMSFNAIKYGLTYSSLVHTVGDRSKALREPASIRKSYGMSSGFHTRHFGFWFFTTRLCLFLKALLAPILS